LRSFFFIPANNQKFINNVNAIDATDIVFDLEDALFNSSIEEGVSNLIKVNVQDFYWVRFSASNNDETSINHLEKLIKAGFCNFILPKVEDKKLVADFVSICNQLTSRTIEIIALLESPSSLLKLEEIAAHPNIKGLGFGSHDYCRLMGMHHTLENIYWARMNVLNMSKALHKICIDITSMNIVNESEFVAECVDGKNKGFDGKFLIHPWQLLHFKKNWKFSENELEFAKKVKLYIDQIGGVNKFNIASIEGVVVEKPHLNRINNILISNGYGSI
jgi:citrate lyase beta subunit